jgi:hypothetical protein
MEEVAGLFFKFHPIINEPHSHETSVISLVSLLFFQPGESLKLFQHLCVLVPERILVLPGGLGRKRVQLVLAKVLRNVGLRLQVPLPQLSSILLVLVVALNQLIAVRDRQEVPAGKKLRKY